MDAQKLKEALLLRMASGKDHPSLAAVEGFEKLGDEGLPFAMVEAGVLLLRRQGKSTDRERARHLFDRAAESGHPFAFYNQAYLHFEDGNYERAVPLFHRAASLGVPQAMTYLGIIRIRNRTEQRHIEEGSDWFMAAALYGDPLGIVQLSMLIRKKEQLDLDHGFIERNLRENASRGHVESMFELGLLFYDGCLNGIFSQYRAIRWASRAAKSGLVAAQLWVGEQLVARSPWPWRRRHGIAWLEEAANAGNPIAKWRIVEFLGTGRYVPADRERAVYWARNLAATGHERAEEFLKWQGGTVLGSHSSQ